MTRFAKPLLLLATLVIFMAFSEGLSQTAAKVVVRPEATMTIEPVESPAPGAPRARWFQVDFIIRMDPGATALLFAESVGVNSRQSFLVKQSGESSQRTIERGAPLLTIQKNGRHSLLVGIVAEERGESLRFVLKSSDGSISVTRIVRP